MGVIGGGKTRDTKTFVAPYTDNLVFAIDAWDKNSYPGSGTTWTDAVNGTEGTLGGGNGAAIRRTSGITVNITNNATITGVTDATGVS